MSYELWVMGYELWIMSYELWVINYGLWIMGYKLWVMNYELWVGWKAEGHNKGQKVNGMGWIRRVRLEYYRFVMRVFSDLVTESVFGERN